MALDWNGTELLSAAELARVVETCLFQNGLVYRGRPGVSDGVVMFEVCDRAGAPMYRYTAARTDGASWNLAAAVTDEFLALHDAGQRPEVPNVPHLIDEAIMKAGKHALWRAGNSGEEATTAAVPGNGEEAAVGAVANGNGLPKRPGPNATREEWYLYKLRCDKHPLCRFTHEQLAKELHLAEGTVKIYYNDWKAGIDTENI